MTALGSFPLNIADRGSGLILLRCGASLYSFRPFCMRVCHLRRTRDRDTPLYMNGNTGDDRGDDGGPHVERYLRRVY